MQVTSKLLQITMIQKACTESLPPTKQVIFNHTWKVSSNLEEEQSLKLDLGQPWAWSISNFIFLASAYDPEWASPLPHYHVFPLIVYSQHTYHSRIGSG